MGPCIGLPGWSNDSSPILRVVLSSSFFQSFRPFVQTGTNTLGVSRVGLDDPLKALPLVLGDISEGREHR
jgi:hypothetical protein